MPAAEDQHFMYMVLAFTVAAMVITRDFAKYRPETPRHHSILVKIFFMGMMLVCTAWHAYWLKHLATGGFETLLSDLSGSFFLNPHTGKQASAAGLWLTDALGLYVMFVAYVFAEGRYSRIWMVLLGPSAAVCYAFYDTVHERETKRRKFTLRRFCSYTFAMALCLRMWLPEILDWIDSQVTGQGRGFEPNPTVAYIKYSIAIGYVFLFFMSCYGIHRAFPYQWENVTGMAIQFCLTFTINIMYFQQVAVAAGLFLLICSCSDSVGFANNRERRISQDKVNLVRKAFGLAVSNSATEKEVLKPGPKEVPKKKKKR